MTGQDLIAQLRQEQEKGVQLGDTLLIPSTMVRSGEKIFLDDCTMQEVEDALGMRLVAVESGGKDFVDAVLRESYRMDRVNDTVGYVRAYDREKEQER